jgi:hypothetical protein
MRILYGIVGVAVLITLTFVATCGVFDSGFAEATIDWFAFLAGIFLIVEGLYRIFSTKDAFFPDQMLRTFRVIIGTCVFTIHLLQFMRF